MLVTIPVLSLSVDVVLYQAWQPRELDEFPPPPSPGFVKMGAFLHCVRESPREAVWACAACFVGRSLIVTSFFLFIFY